MPPESVAFLLLAFFLAVYAAMDGFDLGVGFLHFFARSDHERQASFKTIGPVWDGNEVWLLVAGGTMFAAFPHLYATVFSGFYLALVLLLFCLILRAAALEFRHAAHGRAWQRTWDLVFAASSSVAAVLLGVAIGNVLAGLPLDRGGDYHGGLLGLLRPWPLLCGVTGLALFALHGSLWNLLKYPEDLKAGARLLAFRAWMVFAALYVLLVLAAFPLAPELLARSLAKAGLHWPLQGLALVLLVAIPLLLSSERLKLAFAASFAFILCMFAICAVNLHPLLLPSVPEPANSITIAAAAASPKSLSSVLTIMAIGTPLVLAYTVFVYRVFKGRV